MAEAPSESGFSAVLSEAPSESDYFSAVRAWDLDDSSLPEDVHRHTFAKHMREAVSTMLKDYGGPENYLRVRFQDAAVLNDWLNYLVHLVPLDANHYDFSDDLPSCASADKIEKDYSYNKPKKTINLQPNPILISCKPWPAGA